MPRIGLTVNAYYTEISSSDPEIIGRWFSEQLLRFPELADQSTLLRLRIDPLWSPPTPGHPQGIMDWNPDSRFNWASVQCGETHAETAQAILDAMADMVTRAAEDAMADMVTRAAEMESA